MLYKHSVKFWTSKRQHRTGKFAAVSLMLWLWVGTFALAASPELHRLLHQDAQNPSHHCLVTQVQQQPLLAGLVSSVAPAGPPALIEWVRSESFEFLPAVNPRLHPVRGPPSVISSIPVVG